MPVFFLCTFVDVHENFPSEARESVEDFPSHVSLPEGRCINMPLIFPNIPYIPLIFHYIHIPSSINIFHDNIRLVFHYIPIKIPVTSHEIPLKSQEIPLKSHWNLIYKIKSQILWNPYYIIILCWCNLAGSERWHAFAKKELCRRWYPEQFSAWGSLRERQMGNRELNMVQCGAPKIAKLVYKSRISIGFMVLISIVRWGYKPTYK